MPELMGFVSMPGGMEWLIIMIIGLMTLGIPFAIIVALVLLLRARPWIRETRCRRCGHILRGLTEPRCPECGEAI